MSRSTALALALLLATARLAAAVGVRVEVEGLPGDLERNVLSLLSLREEADDELTDARVRQLHAAAPEEIERALEPFGHYRPVIREELRREGDTWVARYRIDPGPALRIGSVDLRVIGDGAADPGFREVAAAFPLAEGDVLYHPAYESGKEGLTEYAAENGYLDATFEASEVRVDLERYRADVVLHLATGPRYRFGPVTFKQDVLDPDLLVGYVTFERGEPLDVNKVLELQTALSDSPYFERVEVVTRQEQAQGLEVPIEVNLVPAKRQHYLVGVGYGTDTGPRGSADLELRRLNRRGHRGQAELTLSQVEQSFTARYLIPGAYPRTDVLTFSVGYALFDTDSQRSDTALAGATLTRSRGSWREAFSLTYQREDFEVGLDRGVSALLVPGASWSRVEADDRIYPLSGHRLQVQVQGAEEALLSDASFVRLLGEARAVRSLGRGLRAIGRLQVGQTFTSEFRSLPASFRFFAGGDQSVRGYGYQELGPLDEAGNVIGGEALATASLEVDWLFFEKWGRWGTAAFYDAGNAMESFSGSVEQGAGLGIRWLSPIGLVRADAALALTEPGTPVRFHLTIGPDL